MPLPSFPSRARSCPWIPSPFSICSVWAWPPWPLSGFCVTAPCSSSEKMTRARPQRLTLRHRKRQHLPRIIHPGRRQFCRITKKRAETPFFTCQTDGSRLYKFSLRHGEVSELVEGARLEIVCTLKAYQEFESLPLRHKTNHPSAMPAGFLHLSPMMAVMAASQTQFACPVADVTGTPALCSDTPLPGERLLCRIISPDSKRILGRYGTWLLLLRLPVRFPPNYDANQLPDNAQTGFCPVQACPLRQFRRDSHPPGISSAVPHAVCHKKGHVRQCREAHQTWPVFTLAERPGQGRRAVPHSAVAS